ncbi:MAG: uL15 family ribosomal protein [bacterium]
MQLYQLKPNNKTKSSKRIGRGGKHGTYSGRGVKGQKSRAGRKPRMDFAGGDTTAIKRLPKKRGSIGGLKNAVRGPKMFRLKKIRKQVVFNLKDFSDKKWKEGDIISPKSLLENGLVDRIKGRIPRIKILGDGELKNNLKFKNVELSKEAKKKNETTK